MNNIQNLLKQLREAESKATKGEWFDHKEDISTDKDRSLVGYPPQDGAICNLSDGEYIENRNHEADASLIVLMRNNLIPLLDYVEGLEKERTKIATECQKETAKAIFSSIECIKQRYGVSWSGEARINLNKLKKLYNAE